MITIGYVTSRLNCQLDWFLQSLKLQSGLGDVKQIMVIDFFSQAMEGWSLEQALDRKNNLRKVADEYGFGKIFSVHPPKPTPWAGQYKQTKQHWWHVATAKNTLFALADQPFVTCTDDRCVLVPTWLDAVREAHQKNYVVCGSYEKRTGMTVENGVPKHAGIVIGKDQRLSVVKGHKFKCPGPWLFGCTSGMPLEWIMEVNGVDEHCDGLSMEDIIFGNHVANAGYPIYYDPRMHIIEDRTPEFLGVAMRRESKEKHPHDKNDKGHTALKKFAHLSKASHSTNIRELRRTREFPAPEPNATDWFDGQPLSEM